jgi:hypothetical protein
MAGAGLGLYVVGGSAEFTQPLMRREGKLPSHVAFNGRRHRTRLRPWLLSNPYRGRCDSLGRTGALDTGGPNPGEP